MSKEGCAPDSVPHHIDLKQISIDFNLPSDIEIDPIPSTSFSGRPAVGDALGHSSSADDKSSKTSVSLVVAREYQDGIETPTTISSKSSSDESTQSTNRFHLKSKLKDGPKHLAAKKNNHQANNHRPSVDNSDNQSESDKNSSEAHKRVNNLQKLMETNYEFMANFDPEKSSREKRKLNRKLTQSQRNARGLARQSMYNEYGQFRETGVDLCDCLDVACPGCFYPCQKCMSNKCGPRCRNNRRWTFESIEFDGSDQIINNQFIPKPPKVSAVS